MAMSGRELVVYRERLGRFEEVGFVGASEVALTFSYSDSYRRNDSAQSISHALPLGEGELPPSAVKSFFDGLLPEGSMRRVLSASFHTSEDDLHELISRLNDESAGALVFKVAGEDPAWGRGYEPMGDSDFERFAAFPREFASHAAVRSRLFFGWSANEGRSSFRCCYRRMAVPERCGSVEPYRESVRRKFPTADNQRGCLHGDRGEARFRRCRMQANSHRWQRSAACCEAIRSNRCRQRILPSASSRGFLPSFAEVRRQVRADRRELCE